MKKITLLLAAVLMTSSSAFSVSNPTGVEVNLDDPYACRNIHRSIRAVYTSKVRTANIQANHYNEGPQSVVLDMNVKGLERTLVILKDLKEKNCE